MNQCGRDGGVLPVVAVMSAGTAAAAAAAGAAWLKVSHPDKKKSN